MILQENMNGCNGTSSANRNMMNGTTEEKIMPIAITGMSCRLPGDSNSPERLWDLLSKGKSGWTQGAGSRFQSRSFYHPAGELSGVVYDPSSLRVSPSPLLVSGGLTTDIISSIPKASTS